MTTTAYCTSNSIFYQIQLTTTRSQFTPISPRTSSSPTIISISKQKLKQTIKNDENNNRQVTNVNIPDILYITNDDDDDEIVDDIDEEQYLSFVGLRSKTKKPSVPIQTLRPLVKRLAAPVCLLPLPKYGERVRQALYILLPFLKFLSFTHDIDSFCSTDDKAKVESLLPRSVTQARTSTTIKKQTKKRKVPRTEFITMAANTFRDTTTKTPMAKYINSTIQCRVILDRLEQSAIDQIMQNSIQDDQNSIATISSEKRSLRNSSQKPKTSLHESRSSLERTTTKTTTTLTTITTMTTEKTTVEHQLTPASVNQSKRFKTSDNNKSSSTYERIYLKCFVCSKREYIDTQTTNSDILHLHWLEHGNDLSLNIYDSDIDSILTRVVEFFHFPKRHALEGKIQTVFILNSKEIQHTLKDPLSDETCIVID